MVQCFLILEEIEVTFDWLGKQLIASLMDNGHSISVDVLSSKLIRTPIARNLPVNHNCNFITEELSFFNMVGNHDHGRALNVLDDI